MRMVTGDNINTTKAIAGECGILTDDGIAIEGPDFREKIEDELFKIVPKIQVAKESADVIILDDNFSTIVTMAKWGCSVYVNIQYAPLTVVQLLWVNMIMDTLGALALATKPPTDELMERQPFGRKGNIIRNVMWRNIMGQSLYQTMKPSKQVIGFTIGFLL
ncbi:putative cation-transporting P-type ATPase, HAD superfamily [Helianthus annuus]|uniref:Cation-transporting P-type ATPase, HAD superfamily n=1 Tax=Helianthus annuus TaxID=4232 RepID=A0A9K3IHZ1_HELAN|nr:putative cation-transporting P-type ATPase, HAD superfamily [Helianthus annuus]KAJ0548515.1 putative cation-transporting P-type ATPase, HAD superfamily [Helianthus annuus]KAJ0554835.1 putative cation-transporting P-type ATPase, HAD superfamily [Helianthus annuus]KAJ0723606.1 putative cation-transporting P-type ATPase, HAD superfamily [Helianthus annuus]KAJ0899432.1 putative cation-transporting P-type ATPase, HAD superfamily [Helianthus annuus]